VRLFDWNKANFAAIVQRLRRKI